MQLTGDAARAAAETALRSEEGLLTQLYHDYWQKYRDARPAIVAREIVVASIDAQSNEIHSSLPHGLQTGDQVFFNFGVNLNGEDFENAARWEEIVPDYDLATLPAGTLVDLQTEQLVRTSDGLLYRYMGQNAQGVDLTDEDFGNSLAWVEVVPEYDLATLSGTCVEVGTGTLVRTADGALYRYVGANAPVTSLSAGLAYYVVVTGDTTFKLAANRYDAAISGTPVVVDIAVEGDGDWANVRFLEYTYASGASFEEAQAALTADAAGERLWNVHATYGNDPYDPNFIFRFTPAEWQRRVDARTVAPEALRYVISVGLFRRLYPDLDIIGGVQDPSAGEKPNIIGGRVTLTTPNGSVGNVSDLVTVELGQGYESSPEEHRAILAAATADDLLGVTYALYEYLGTAAYLDLGEQDFGDPRLWQRLQTNFVTGTSRLEPQDVSIAHGDIVLVRYGIVYHLYRYLGEPADHLDLAAQNYAGSADWKLVIADHSGIDGVVLVAPGELVQNRLEIERLILKVWDDVDLDASVAVVIDARDNVAVQAVAARTAGDLRIEHVHAGGDVRLGAQGAVIDLYTDGTAAVVTPGDLMLAAESSVEGADGVRPLRVQIAPTSRFSADVGGELHVRQVSGDLYVYRVYAGGGVVIEVPMGDMILGDVSSATSVDLDAINVITQLGSRIGTTGEGGLVDIDAVEAVQMAGWIEARGASSRVDIDSGTTFTLSVFGAIVAGGSIGQAASSGPGRVRRSPSRRASRFAWRVRCLRPVPYRSTGAKPARRRMMTTSWSLSRRPAGLARAAWESEAARGRVGIFSAGRLEIMGHILSGGTVLQQFDDEGNLISETISWSGEPSDVYIEAEGQAFIGGTTTNQQGQSVQTGGYVQAGRNITIVGGASPADDTGVKIHAASELTTHNPDGSILIQSAGDIEALGVLLAGGGVVDIRDAQGNYLGRRLENYGGHSTLRLEAGHQIRVGTELQAGVTLDLVGGEDPLDGTEHSGKGIVLYGSAHLRTWADSSIIVLTAPGRVDILAPISGDLYAIEAPAPGSQVSIDVPAGGTHPDQKLYLAGRILAGGRISLHSGPSVEIDLDLTGLLETMNGSIELQAADYAVIRGDILVGGVGSSLLLSAGTTEALGQTSIRTEPTSHIRALGGQIRITGVNDVVIDSQVGPGSTDLALVRIEAIHGTLLIAGDSGQVEAGGLIELRGGGRGHPGNGQEPVCR